MGAVNTTYTFTATDVITSAKMNNIIDQTTFTTDAVSGDTLAVSIGKLKVNSQGITSNELAENSVTTNAIKDLNVTTNKIANSSVTLEKLATGLLTGPAFRVYQSTATQLPSSVVTKIIFNVENFDTNSNFDSTTNHRFTPTVAGYYQINAQIAIDIGYRSLQGYIYKNGSAYVQFEDSGDRTEDTSKSISVSDLIYLNGTSDYIELYGFSLGFTRDAAVGSTRTFMSGFLARPA